MRPAAAMPVCPPSGPICVRARGKRRRRGAPGPRRKARNSKVPGRRMRPACQAGWGSASGGGRNQHAGAGHRGKRRFFIFLFFIFVFYKKYIFDLEIYRNIPRPPRCRAAGAFLKKISQKKLHAGPWGRSPGSGATGPGRPAAGRPAVIFAI